MTKNQNVATAVLLGILLIPAHALVQAYALDAIAHWFLIKSIDSLPALSEWFGLSMIVRMMFVENNIEAQKRHDEIKARVGTENLERKRLLVALIAGKPPEPTSPIGHVLAETIRVWFAWGSIVGIAALVRWALGW